MISCNPGNLFISYNSVLVDSLGFSVDKVISSVGVLERRERISSSCWLSFMNMFVLDGS